MTLKISETPEVIECKLWPDYGYVPGQPINLINTKTVINCDY